MELVRERQYWDRAANEKRFHHPLRLAWLDSHLAGRDILDCGCGYGRLLTELAQGGYHNAVGTDFSEGMLGRCNALHPDLNLRLVQTDGRTLPFRDHSFDVVLLFTLLTCMPMESEQRGLFAEVQRVLRRSGLVYISDLLLNTDSRNMDRYKQFAEQSWRCSWLFPACVPAPECGAPDAVGRRNNGDAGATGEWNQAYGDLSTNLQTSISSSGMDRLIADSGCAILGRGIGTVPASSASPDSALPAYVKTAVARTLTRRVNVCESNTAPRSAEPGSHPGWSRKSAVSMVNTNGPKRELRPTRTRSVCRASGFVQTFDRYLFSVQPGRAGLDLQIVI
jgi:SAM-dependent methyltransferase